MGVLDIPKHRLLIREAVTHDILHAEDYASDDNDHHNLVASERPRRQKTPKLGRKNYGHHDFKRGNGVRRKRRNDNLFFLYSLMDGIDPEDIQDEDELNMTAFGELFADPTKMKAWTEFVNMAEEDQQHFLESTQKVKHSADKKENKEMDDPEFGRIEQNIRDFLRSEQLSKDVLADFEEDLMFTFSECPFDALVLNIPSSFERMMVHGLCQYMQLRAQTHKFKKKRFMEIENASENFSRPTRLLSEYLETFQN